MEYNNQLNETIAIIKTKHPNWPQEKTRWIALQALNIIVRR